MNEMDYVRLANRLAKTTTKTVDEAASIVTSLREQGSSYSQIENLIEIGWHNIDASKLKTVHIDKINPSHYKRYNLEMIENIQNSMTHDEFIGYLKGNIMKYMSRYQDKNGVEDIKKAEWHIKKMIEVVSDDGRQDK